MRAGQALACLRQHLVGGMVDIDAEPAEAADAVAGLVVDPDGVGAGQDLGIAHPRPPRFGATAPAFADS